MRERGLRWELLYLGVEELEEASPREQRMNDVFLSHKCVDKRSPALPVGASSSIFSLSCFLTFSLCSSSSSQTDRESLAQRGLRSPIMKPSRVFSSTFTPPPAVLPLLLEHQYTWFGSYEYSETCTYDHILTSHTSDASPGSNTTELSCKFGSRLKTCCLWVQIFASDMGSVIVWNLTVTQSCADVTERLWTNGDKHVTTQRNKVVEWRGGENSIKQSIAIFWMVIFYQYTDTMYLISNYRND